MVIVKNQQIFENLRERIRRRKIKEYKNKQYKKYEREERNKAYERAMKGIS